VNPILILIIIIVYLGIGIGAMFRIRQDSEFREMETVSLFAYGSIILWPILWPLYELTKSPEQLEDLGAKKTYQDFKNFMRTRKKSDMDLFTRLDKATSPDKPIEISDERDDYRDYPLEELISQGKWMEALRTANDMLRFAREQQEHGRALAYERYIFEIKEKRRQESTL